MASRALKNTLKSSSENGMVMPSRNSLEKVEARIVEGS